MDRRGRILGSYLFRLFRLFRHGDWAGSHARDSTAYQLFLALSCNQHHRFLAALAHDIVSILARLPVHSARWKTAGASAPLPEFDGRYAPGRTLAWSQLEPHALGREARRVSRG